MASAAHCDHGSLVSLSRYSAIGSLMRHLVRCRMVIKGRLARSNYVSPCRQPRLDPRLARTVIGRVDQVIQPRIKVHQGRLAQEIAVLLDGSSIWS